MQICKSSAFFKGGGELLTIEFLSNLFFMQCEELCAHGWLLDPESCTSNLSPAAGPRGPHLLSFLFWAGTNPFYLPMSFLEGHLSPQRLNSLNSSGTTQTVAGAVRVCATGPRFQLSGWNEQILRQSRFIQTKRKEKITHSDVGSVYIVVFINPSSNTSLPGLLPWGCQFY